MINGVVIKSMRRIPDDRGKILHIMKSSDSEFSKFGEVFVIAFLKTSTGESVFNCPDIISKEP